MGLVLQATTWDVAPLPLLVDLSSTQLGGSGGVRLPPLVAERQCGHPPGPSLLSSTFFSSATVGLTSMSPR